MTSIVPYSKNLLLYYGFHSNVVLLKASNTDDMFWIDFDDFNIVKNFSWRIEDNGYLKANHQKKSILLHRLVQKANEGEIIDHKNCNKLDNRKQNLRKATVAQNNQNRIKQKNNTSGFKGVSFLKLSGKWQVKIEYMVNNVKNCKYKLFHTKDEAAIQYDIWVREYHKEFAVLNNV